MNATSPGRTVFAVPAERAKSFECLDRSKLRNQSGIDFLFKDTC